MDLADEIEAINSNQKTSLRLQFPGGYPDVPPVVLATQSSGEHAKKGEAAYVLDLFRSTLASLFSPGQVCLFDVIDDVTGVLDSEVQDVPVGAQGNPETLTAGDLQAASQKTTTSVPDELYEEEPPWTISGVVTELKSVFVARCAPVNSPEQAKQYLQHLLDSDKKVAKATHNITAWRIQGEHGVTFQDCDDDGETAAGGRVLHLMQLMDLWNVMIVVTRWYGGQKLGPARFGIINGVARDSFVRGGFVQEQETGKKKAKR